MTDKVTPTPGPWIVNPFCAQVDCGAVSVKGGLLPVAQMLWPTDERSEAETVANARLIAASPDLLAACEAVDRMFSEPGKFNKNSVRDCVRAAIVKATGATL